MSASPIPSRIRLGINVDHVATLRNARGGTRPDPVRAALAAIEAGADGITAHLREDRRHILDEDMARLKSEISKPLNFEMAATPEMLEIALRTKPHAVCLVPEKRSERTTEGGLDVVGGHNHLVPYVAALADHGIRVSLFIEPNERAIETAVRLRAPVVELHTGAWCEAVLTGDRAGDSKGLEHLKLGAKLAHAAGLEVHAGHGLDFDTARRLAAVAEFVEFNIGHFLMGEALFYGFGPVIGEMRHAMDEGRGLK
jgi:pyridoxine 5-phosphate synthase